MYTLLYLYLIINILYLPDLKIMLKCYIGRNNIYVLIFTMGNICQLSVLVNDSMLYTNYILKHTNKYSYQSYIYIY